MPTSVSTGGYGANWINELDDTRPLGTESKSFGDDAIREIKRSLSNTFPNAETGIPLSADFGQLNDLAAGNTLPKDSIIMWGGNQTSLPNGPDGWTICDGRARAGGGNSPDMRAKFIWGAKPDTDNSSNGVKAGQVGGNNSTQIKQTNGNTVEFSTNGHVLKENELPAHAHKMFHNGTGNANLPGGGDRVAVRGEGDTNNNYWYHMDGTNGSTPTGDSFPVGANAAHTHKFNIDDGGGTTSNVSRYYSALYIIKD